LESVLPVPALPAAFSTPLLARVMRLLVPGIESVFLTPDARFQHISSTLVREIATLHGDVAQFVAPSVLARLQAKLHPGA
jgi:pantetheine-phosphate adenylyltransferase